jgi:hypothetical protein
MQIGDQSTNADRPYDTPALQATFLPMPQSHPLPIRELLATDQPRNRLLAHGGHTRRLSDQHQKARRIRIYSGHSRFGGCTSRGWYAHRCLRSRFFAEDPNKLLNDGW